MLWYCITVFQLSKMLLCCFRLWSNITDVPFLKMEEEIRSPLSLAGNYRPLCFKRLERFTLWKRMFSHLIRGLKLECSVVSSVSQKKILPLY